MEVVAELIESFEVPRSTKVVVLFASFSFHHRFSTLVKIGGGLIYWGAHERFAVS